MRAEEMASKIKGLAVSDCERQDGEIAAAGLSGPEEAKLRDVLRGFSAAVVLLTTTVPEIIQPLVLKFLSDQLGDMEKILSSSPGEKGLCMRMAAERVSSKYKEMENADLSLEEVAALFQVNSFLMRVMMSMIAHLPNSCVPLFLKFGREQLSDMGKVFCLDNQ